MDDLSDELVLKALQNALHISKHTLAYVKGILRDWHERGCTKLSEVEEAVKTKALAKIERLEDEIRQLDIAMAADHIEYEELNQLYGRKLELHHELDSAMELWLSFGD